MNRALESVIFVASLFIDAFNSFKMLVDRVSLELGDIVVSVSCIGPGVGMTVSRVDVPCGGVFSFSVTSCSFDFSGLCMSQGPSFEVASAMLAVELLVQRLVVWLGVLISSSNRWSL